MELYYFGKMKLITKEGLKKSVVLSPGEIAVTVPYEHHALVGISSCKVLVLLKVKRWEGI